MEIFEIRNLSFAYPEQTEYAIKDLSLTVHPGDFLVLCGPSGCGKSTLLRQLKSVLAPHGHRSGEICFAGRPLAEIDSRTQAAQIGFVRQSTENQIVTDKVWHELAFGLESLGHDTPFIRRRVAEMASFFGIEDWFYKDVAQLSGGQKQLLNLASVMAMDPAVLILDEPTSQLDPIAAGEFLSTLGKINRELGTTILLTEHRLEEAFPLATRVIVMDKGKVLCMGTPAEVGAQLRAENHGMFLAMPTAMRIWAACGGRDPCPVTVREGRHWLMGQGTPGDLPAVGDHSYPEKPALQIRETWFRYESNSPDVIRGLDLTLHKGEFLALLGGNGTGKSTSLRLLAGLQKPYRGTVQQNGKTVLLPQDPQTLFVKKTVWEDLLDAMQESGIPKSVQEEKAARIARLCRLEDLLDRHPYDLSGGEQQRAALGRILLLEPEILLLDEPTKGLDAEFKQVFAEILQTLLQGGVSILMVSHDIEFCASHAHRCALFFDGSIVTAGEPKSFFSGNSFYTTAANRMARGILDGAVTPEDIIYAYNGILPEKTKLPPSDEPIFLKKEETENVQTKLPLWRRILAALSGGAAMVLFFWLTGQTDLTSLLNAEGLTALSGRQLQIYGIFLCLLFLFAFSITRRSTKKDAWMETALQKRKLSRRTRAAAFLILLLIPLTLFVGETWLGGRKYYFISLLILLETMVPFFLIFEERKPQARELVVVAALCAIGIAGRAMFFMLPNFKPVVALTIIAGVAFGGETGFLVGAMTMLLSNVLFSQGPWTPWQMFAAGIIGFIAGLLFRKGLLRRGRTSLSIFGALVTILIYGGIMNTSSALMWMQELDWKIITSYIITGFPIDCVHAASTFLFLWLAAEPMLEKLDRIKVKYGLNE